MAKLLRPAPFFTHRLHRKPLNLGYPLIVLPGFAVLSDGDVEQLRGVAVQYLITDEFAREFTFHRFAHRQPMLVGNRRLEILPPPGQNKPGTLAVHPHNDDAGASLRLGKLESPAIVLGIDMSRHDLLPVLDDSFSGEIERCRIIRRDDKREKCQPPQEKLRLFPVPPLSHRVFLPHG